MRLLPLLALTSVIVISPLCAAQDDGKFNEDQFVGYGLKAPPGLFKHVNDTTVGGAVILRGIELFIDDRLVESLEGTRRQLNQPVKYEHNPVLVSSHPQEGRAPGYGTVHYDAEAKLFKMWYQGWLVTEGTSTGVLCYATSKDGIQWDKPALNNDGTNL